MDIFDLIGPIMVGPSSSHTAGAVRMGLACRRILGEEIAEADILLSGSFAATGRGHGTDKAIIGGLLGMAPDDVRVPDSFRYAQEKGLIFSFSFGEIPMSHPNTARLVLKGVSGAEADIEAASLGGGRIEIRRIGDMALRFSAEQPTLIIRNEDKPGTVAEVSRVLSEEKINIATFHVNRNARGGTAVMVIECDTPLNDTLLARIRRLPGILRAVYINQD
ncbi:MAG: L-serine ammonia-lyase, iron-sulfur-dependent subunit beta [Oscillospiraceae bacterium]|nr:L-serine ammonia-lyase, iron-sulfur-dependent subunit beta [Oscillospiraceae bacterium]